MVDISILKFTLDSKQKKLEKLLCRSVRTTEIETLRIEIADLKNQIAAAEQKQED